MSSHIVSNNQNYLPNIEEKIAKNLSEFIANHIYIYLNDAWTVTNANYTLNKIT